jgi:osmotically-inducible protein OsmY
MGLKYPIHGPLPFPDPFSNLDIKKMLEADTLFAEQIGAAIDSNPYLTGRRVRVETEDGRVVLSGIVGSYYQKQMAQEVLRKIRGVRQIDNRLTVTA